LQRVANRFPGLPTLSALPLTAGRALLYLQGVQETR